jgi:hypothetical protein
VLIDIWLAKKFLFLSGPGEIRQENFQNSDSMQLEGGFGGMELKIEMNLPVDVGQLDLSPMKNLEIK